MRAHASLAAVRNLRAQQEQIVRAAYARALDVVEQTSRDLQLARHELEEALALLHKQIQDGAVSDFTKLLQHIEGLRLHRRVAEERATAARREAEQAFVSVIAARRACRVLAKYSEQQKVARPQNRSLTVLQSTKPGQVLWN